MIHWTRRHDYMIVNSLVRVKIKPNIYYAYISGLKYYSEVPMFRIMSVLERTLTHELSQTSMKIRASTNIGKRSRKSSYVSKCSCEIPRTWKIEDVHRRSSMENSEIVDCCFLVNRLTSCYKSSKNPLIPSYTFYRNKLLLVSKTRRVHPQWIR